MTIQVNSLSCFSLMVGKDQMMRRMPRTYSSQLDGIVLLGELARFRTRGIVIEQLCAIEQIRDLSVLVPPVERKRRRREEVPCSCEGSHLFLSLRDGVVDLGQVRGKLADRFEDGGAVRSVLHDKCGQVCQKRGGG